MFPVIPFGIAVAFYLGGYVVARGVMARRRVARRAALLDVLAAAARHGRPFGPVLSSAASARKANGRAALELAAEQVAAGETLSDVLARVLPKEFPPYVADAIRAAEGTRRLPTTLEALGDEATRDGTLAHRTAMATAYPALLGVSLLLLHFGLLEAWMGPTLASIDGDGPPSMLMTPILVARWAFLIVAAALCLPWLLRKAAPTATDAAAGRWLRTLATGLDAGHGLRVALKFAGGAAGERRLATATKALSSSVDAGRPLPGALPTLPFPARVRARLSAGEGVPSPAALREIADGCARRHTALRERWIHWAVPVATVLVGLVIAVDYAVLMSLWRHAAEVARS